MELTTIIGVVIGIASVIGAMFFKSISLSVFFNPAALLIIFAGTVAAVMNAYPGKTLKNVGTLFKILFIKRKLISEEEIINMMVELSGVDKKEGLLALESRLEDIADPFIKKAVRMIVDGTSSDIIEEILYSEIDSMEQRHQINAGIFASAGMYAPTLGVLGAVFGLIAAMATIDNVDIISHAIAAAFIATILGIFTGYVLWNPFAKKLQVKSKYEVILKQMIVEGVLSIQRGYPPFMIKERLLAMLSSKQQLKILNKMEQEKEN